MNGKNFDIGKKIKDVLFQRGMSVADLAKLINESRQNVNIWLKKDDISVNKLLTISEVLNYDFFKFYRLKDNEQDTTPKVSLQIVLDPTKNEELLDYIKKNNMIK